ncbi:hypothetical protein ATCC90586_005304 [Pythium insidiosum]|nr:hypothetical protein ATCC90586_005304 [Pythium insidiosum]
MHPRLSPANLTRLADTITRQHHTLQKKLAGVRSHLQVAMADFEAASAEVREARDRLCEIEAFLDDVEEEIADMETSGEDEEVIESKCAEQQELLDEREDELSLIDQLERALELRASVVAHLRRVFIVLTRDLARVRTKEQLLLMLALRSGAIKPVLRKRGQEDLLQQALRNVRDQAFRMKRAMDAGELSAVLKHAAEVLRELRTSLLSPKNYYQLSLELMITSVRATANLSASNYEVLATKTTQYAAKLLKKTDQVSMVLNCAHLFWAAAKLCEQRTLLTFELHESSKQLAQSRDIEKLEATS